MMDTPFSHPQHPHHRSGPPAQNGCASCTPYPAHIEAEADTRRLLAVERDNRALKDRLDETQAKVDLLERRLSAALAAFARQQPELPSDGQAEHQLVAQDFRAFVEHRLYPLAQAAASTSTLQIPREAPASLWLLGIAASALFQERPRPDTLTHALQLGATAERDLADRTEHAYTSALAFWNRSQTTRLPFCWDFRFTAGERTDTTRQETWPSCPASAPAQFVIAPAYVVENRVYAHQRLYTGWASARP